MKISLKNNGYINHGELFCKIVAKRIDVEFAGGGMLVELQIDKTIADKESFLICENNNHWIITGSDELGLYFGIGKFLHTAVWSENDFIPRVSDGVVTPECSFRAMYFATHFYNFYHTATDDALCEYLDELLLWGYNTIICIVSVITLNEQSESFESDFKAEALRVNRIYDAAKRRGMKIGLLVTVNQGFMDAPDEISSELPDDLTYRGDLGRNICTSKPDGLAYMQRVWKLLLDAFKEQKPEYILTWPYDEGGCGCKDCRPWGAKGYLNACIEFKKTAVSIIPDAKYIISTWAYDVPDDEGEYEGLYKRLTGDMNWADYLMVDAHREYPRYPLEHELIKPVVNFPEISMWGQNPWGGYGANPLPERFERIWNDSKRILDGGLPYSEGIYEDISKIQFIGYYWKKDRVWTDILAEYINYEYSSSPSVIDDVLELMRLIEFNHTRCANPVRQAPDMDVAKKAMHLAQDIDLALTKQRKSTWRWRILYIRAILDYKRYDAYLNYHKTSGEPLGSLKIAADLLARDNEAQDFFRELIKYYHCVEFNGKNGWTLPPLGGLSIRGENKVPDRRDQAIKSGKKMVVGNEG